MYPYMLSKTIQMCSVYICRYDAGVEFAVFPKAAKGGTIMVLRGETSSQQEFRVFVRERDACVS